MLLLLLLLLLLPLLFLSPAAALSHEPGHLQQQSPPS
jgi:hypothetical protein